jgi:hypothetical protein
MRLIPHLAWHDLRSQRALLLAWVATLALLPAAPLVDPALHLPLPRIPGALLTRFLLTGFLAALIIQRDPLVGTTAFWLTRPISRTTLYVSKFVSLVTVLVALPWVVVLITWWSMGALASDVVRAANAVAVEQGVVTLLAVMAACITSSLTHFVVALVAGFALVGAAGGLVLPMALRLWPLLVWQPDVFIVALLVLGLPIVAYQYIRRREARSAAMVIVALLAAIATGFAWPAEPRIRPSRPVDQTLIKQEDVNVSLDPETVIEQSWSEEIDGVAVPRTQLSAVITAESPSDAVLLSAVAIDSRLLFSDRTVSDRMFIPSARVSGPRSSTRKHPFGLAKQAALDPCVVLTPPYFLGSSFGRTDVATLPADLADRHKGEPVILNGTVTFRASRYRVRGAFPARPGTRVAFPGSALEITSVSISPAGAAIRFREASVRSLRPETIDSPEYYLRNAARHEAFGLEFARVSSTPLTLIPRVVLMTGTWQVRSNSYAFTDSRIDDAWLEGAELVRLEREDLGTFTRPLHAEFTLGRGK